jgi:hypothetical protein
MEWELELMLNITCKFLILSKGTLYKDNNKLKFNKSLNTFSHLITNFKLFKKVKMRIKIKNQSLKVVLQTEYFLLSKMKFWLDLKI